MLQKTYYLQYLHIYENICTLSAQYLHIICTVSTDG